MTDFESNKKLVFYWVNKRYKNRSDKEDLIQEGMIGLFKAVKTYRESPNLKFSTYATFCIFHEIDKYLKKENKHSKLINFSNVDQDESEAYGFVTTEFTDLQLDLVMKKLSNGEKLIMQLFLKGYTQKEIASKFGLSQSHVGKLLKKIRRKCEYQFIK